jgi:hypothetical protein
MFDPSEEDLALALDRLPRMTAAMTDEERRALIRLPRMTAAMNGKERCMLDLIWHSVQSRQIIDAMTDEERSNPDLIDSSRRTRIADNSGTEPQEVEKLLAGFDQLRAARRGLTHWRLFKIVFGGLWNAGVIPMLLVVVICFSSSHLLWSWSIGSSDRHSKTEKVRKQLVAPVTSQASSQARPGQSGSFEADGPSHS